MTVFRLIPVLDLQGGQAVHAVRGDRENYRPLLGRYAPSSSPAEILASLASVLPHRIAYVADLDRILGKGDNLHLLEEAAAAGWTFWIDAGLRDSFPILTATPMIAGTETVRSPDALGLMITSLESALIVSVDLRGGQPLHVHGSDWPKESAVSLLNRVAALGARRIILLDLAVIGSLEGPSHLDLARFCKKKHPRLELYLGGGIRGPADVLNCQRAGLDGVLVATALQSGALDELLKFQPFSQGA